MLLHYACAGGAAAMHLAAAAMHLAAAAMFITLTNDCDTTCTLESAS